ncbi:hypothetical protein HYPSUDRAFT_32611 [Hypholoma sublateritium FD-334 SS-4]|uniref:Uncharacterized protein n=1 Tax=Hypholoma sublateritium (strain FD-334 SS-4) TaxID=945553 RepID=A0A0D2MYS2_HYPSF|nr:hypothetical protein HYPSUDRAFT_32611 [Hypholoma sublateritium FD-334 SS-4]
MARAPLIFLPHIFLFLLSLSLSVRADWKKWEATNFCKCICFGSTYEIMPLTVPDNPSQPCLSCTKQWCLNQNLHICAGASLGNTNPDTATGKEGDVEARCFQRDSPRDQLVVTLFLLTVFGLLLGAGIKNRMQKAGISGGLPWNRTTQERWWEPWIPRRQGEEDAPLGLSRFGMSAVHPSVDRGDYAPVSDDRS